MSELFPCYFSCINNFHLSLNSLGSHDENLVSENDFFLWDETPEAETITLGDLGNLMKDLSLRLLLPAAISWKYIFPANSYIIFYPKI